MTAATEDKVLTTGAVCIVTVPREQLLAALLEVNKARCRDKDDPPILQTVHFSVDGKTLRLTATDLSIAIRRELEVSVESGAKASACIPLKRVGRWLMDSTSRSILLSFEKEYLVFAGDGEEYARVRILDPGTYPKIFDPQGQSVGSIPVDGLTCGLASIRHAVPVEPIQGSYSIDHILLQIDNGVLSITATDGHRLALKKMPASCRDTALLFPGEYLKVLLDLTGALGDAPINVVTTELGIYLTWPGGWVRLRSQEAKKYPNLSPILGKTHPYWFDIRDVAVFRAAVKRCVHFSDDRGHMLELEIGHCELRITGGSLEDGQAQEVIGNIDFEVPRTTLRINGQYLADALEHAGGSSRLSFTDAHSQIEIADDNGYRAVVMPIKPPRK